MENNKNYTWVVQEVGCEQESNFLWWCIVKVTNLTDGGDVTYSPLIVIMVLDESEDAYRTVNTPETSVRGDSSWPVVWHVAGVHSSHEKTTDSCGWQEFLQRPSVTGMINETISGASSFYQDLFLYTLRYTSLSCRDCQSICEYKGSSPGPAIG